MKTSFEKGFADRSGIILPDPEAGKWRLDIETANILGLRNAGIRPENLGAGGFCTACRTDEFYSWRKEKGLTGRQAALVALLPV